MVTEMQYAEKTEEASLFRQIFKALLAIVVIPNLVLYGVCLWTGTDRAVINVDYVLPALIAFSRYRYTWILSLLLFVTVFFFDVALLGLQYFPFIKISDLVYLGYFFLEGPLVYRVIFLSLLGLMMVEFFFSFNVAKSTRKVFMLLLLAAICACQLVISAARRDAVEAGNAQSVFRFADSGLLFFLHNQNSDFMTLRGLATLTPAAYKNATAPWFATLDGGKAPGDKLLLIVVESWGATYDPAIFEALLKNLKSDMSRFEFFHQGDLTTVGLTVAGELRELCHLEPNTLHLDEVIEGFEVCLPNRLKKFGFHSIASHGSKNLMYEREYWYPRAGFDEYFYGVNFGLPMENHSLPGVHDLDLMTLLPQAFLSHEKLFYYWLTLTAHSSYMEEDLRARRFSCEQFNLSPSQAGCVNLALHAQFLDGLAKLIKEPGMQGVEVIIAGDHPPTALKLGENVGLFKPAAVSWLHFKVRAGP